VNPYANPSHRAGCGCADPRCMRLRALMDRLLTVESPSPRRASETVSPAPVWGTSAAVSAKTYGYPV
jgi:hypothetical protein